MARVVVSLVVAETFFQQPMTVGGRTFPNRVLLAPLAGVSDVPFRRIAQELGAGLTFVEMLSAVGIQHGNKRTLDMCRRHPDEPVLGVQVTGPSAALVEEAVRFMEALPFDMLDINMGCAVRKVIGSGSGSAILSDPERISATVAGARAATDRPLAVKTRLGATRRHLTIEDTARRVVDAGADMFTIHGRARNEKYGQPADLAGIARGVAAARAAAANRPVIIVGNGDIFDADDATRMQAETACDAVMVSRGALGNPWVFRSILEQRNAHPTLEEWADVVLRHLDYQIYHYGDTRIAAITARKHLLWYIKGFPHHKLLGEVLGHCDRIADAREAIQGYLRQWPADLQRFSGAQQTDPRFAANSKYDPKFDMNRIHDRAVGNDEV